MFQYRNLLVNPKERRVIVVESILSTTTRFRNILASVFFRHFEVSFIHSPLWAYLWYFNNIFLGIIRLSVSVWVLLWLNIVNIQATWYVSYKSLLVFPVWLKAIESIVHLLCYWTGCRLRWLVHDSYNHFPVSFHAG